MSARDIFAHAMGTVAAILAALIGLIATNAVWPPA